MQEIGIELNGEWSPCWLWIGRLNRPDGYPHISIRRPRKKKRWIKGKSKTVACGVLAHRLSHELHKEIKLGPFDVLRHLCHHSRCIHPDHTVPGTQAENVHDQYERGTHINQREREPGEDDE